MAEQKNTNPEKVISTRPLDENEKLLQKKFYEDLANQSERVDVLSAYLLNIELAIPGLYAGVLKLISGDGASLDNTSTVRLTFLLWFIALILTIIALTPKKYAVDPNVFTQDPNRMKEDGIGIEDYFTKTAQYKRRFALASALFFFFGVVSAVFTIG